LVLYFYLLLLVCHILFSVLLFTCFCVRFAFCLLLATCCFTVRVTVEHQMRLPSVHLCTLDDDNDTVDDDDAQCPVTKDWCLPSPLSPIPQNHLHLVPVGRTGARIPTRPLS